MEYQDGFYKYDGSLLYAMNFVKSNNFELLREDKDTYDYPVQGWHWFDSLEDACMFFDINIDDYLPKEEELVFPGMFR
jgi:hypothetical protein